MQDPSVVTRALHIGIDIAKQGVEVSGGSHLPPLTFNNENEGVKALLMRLGGEPVAPVVVKVTGGLGAALACAMRGRGYA